MDRAVKQSRGCVTLKPEDIPGGVLPRDKSVKDCTNLQLQRWLECRGLKKNGSKLELVARVINCVNAGRENITFSGVGGAKWHDAKRNLMQTASVSHNLLGTPLISLRWGRFSSQDIPKYFNKGHIYTYIEGIQFENEEYEVRDSEEGITERPFRRGS